MVMPILFSCECGQQLKVSDEHAGKKGKCRKCGRTVHVPITNPNAATVGSVQSDGGNTAPPTVPHLPEASVTNAKGAIEVACPNCRKRFHLDLQGLSPKGSLRIICDYCGVEKRLASFQKELGRQISEAEHAQRQNEEKRRGDSKKEAYEQELSSLFGDVVPETLTSSGIKRQERPSSSKKDSRSTRRAGSGSPATSGSAQTGMNTGVASEALGWILVAIPAATTFLVWFWVGNMNLLQSPDSNLALLVAATVITTSILMTVEASQLGMGKVAIGGKRGTSPAGWLFSGLLLWIIGYPAYLRARRNYGVSSRCLLGLLVAAVFTGSTVAMGIAIEQQKAKVREAFVGLSDSFRELGESFSDLGISTDDSYSPSGQSGNASHDSGKTFEIVEIDAKPTSQDEFMVELSWKVVLKSTTNRPAQYTAHIKFLDQDEFVVSQDIQLGLRLEPHERKTFSFETMISPEESSQIKSYHVEVREL